MRKFVGIAVGLGLVALSWQVMPGLAASLQPASVGLASGSAAVERCDTDGVATSFNRSAIAPYPIVSVSVAGVSSGCEDRLMAVTVNNGTTTASGSTTVPMGGGSLIVTLSGSISLGDATQTSVSIS